MYAVVRTHCLGSSVILNALLEVNRKYKCILCIRSCRYTIAVRYYVAESKRDTVFSEDCEEYKTMDVLAIGFHLFKIEEGTIPRRPKRETERERETENMKECQQPVIRFLCRFVWKQSSRCKGRLVV